MGSRPHLFCLIPPELADELLEPVTRAFADEPGVAVLVERRGRDSGMRSPFEPAPAHPRAPVAERDLVRALPAKLRAKAHHLRFVQRLEPVGASHQHTATEDLVDAIRDGDPEAASELWWRCAERVQARLRFRLGDVGAANAGNGVLGRILDELVATQSRPDPLWAWLDDVVDRYAAQHRRSA